MVLRSNFLYFHSKFNFEDNLLGVKWRVATPWGTLGIKVMILTTANNLSFSLHTMLHTANHHIALEELNDERGYALIG